MAKATSKSGLAGKLGAALNKAVTAHADDETSFDSGGRLPAGLEDVIAQLTKCYFSQYEKGDNKGEYYFRAEGVVVSPSEVTVDATGAVAAKGNTSKIEGKQTSIMRPCCETTKGDGTTVSLEEHIEWILNEMRKLGADTKGATGDDLEALAAALVEEAPYFRLRTWRGEATKQYPNPRTNEVWQGAVEYTPDEAADNGVDDNTEKAAEGEELGLDELGEAADGGDEDAQATLTEHCTEAGLDPDHYETWALAATALGETAGDDQTEEVAEEEVEPAVGEVWDYIPIDPKTKKKGKKKIQVEVKSVIKSKKQVNCLNLDDNKQLYKNVPFSELTSD